MSRFVFTSPHDDPSKTVTPEAELDKDGDMVVVRKTQLVLFIGK